MAMVEGLAVCYRDALNTYVGGVTMMMMEGLCMCCHDDDGRNTCVVLLY